MRVITLLAALALALVAVPAGANPTLVPKVDQLYISAGCPQDTPGTCTSTRWLGKTAGDANSNFLTATTPVDEVLYRATGAINWRDYSSDSSIRAGGYVLNADKDLLVDLTVMSNALMLNDTIHARVSLTLAGSTIPVQLPAQSQEVLLVAPLSSQVIPFAFDLPADLQGRTATALTVEVAVHGVNAQGGYINQSGASTVRIPHLVPQT